MTADISQSPDHTSSLSDWLNYMQQIHVSAIDMGLSRVMPVAEHLGLIQSAKKDAYVFTVAGTNGKGSTTAVISEVCQQAGYKTALYQSPHLIDFNERIRIDGKAVGDDELVDAFTQVETARLACDLTLSFFEMTTLAAMLIFAQANCDVWVLEVGLGGRLDVVNIIDPDLAVITNIGIDHVDWLGDTRDKIGYEKAGILRSGITLIYGETDMPASVQDKIDELNVSCFQVGQDYSYLTNAQVSGEQKQFDKCDVEKISQDYWQFSSAAITLRLPTPKLSLSNTANAIAVLLASSLSITQDDIAQALLTVNLAGRFDVRVLDDRLWVFDVAHNVEGMTFFLPSFIQLWHRHYAQDVQVSKYTSQYSQSDISTKNTHPVLHIVFSMLADKAIEAVVGLLLTNLSDMKPKPRIHWHIAPIDHPRAAKLDAIDGSIRSQSDMSTTVINQYSSLSKAAHEVVTLTKPNNKQDDKSDQSSTRPTTESSTTKPPNNVILVCGSFHTIGEVMQALEVKPY